jgi:hypothetical protein
LLKLSIDDRGNDENDEENDEVTLAPSPNLRRRNSVPGATKEMGILPSLAELKQIKSDSDVPTLVELGDTKSHPRSPISRPTNPHPQSNPHTAQVYLMLGYLSIPSELTHSQPNSGGLRDRIFADRRIHLSPRNASHARSSSAPENPNPPGLGIEVRLESRITDVGELQPVEFSSTSLVPPSGGTDSEDRFQSQLSLAKSRSLMDMRANAEKGEDADLLKAINNSLTESYRYRYQ